MYAQAPALPGGLQASFDRAFGTLATGQDAAASAAAAAERAFAASLRQVHGSSVSCCMRCCHAPSALEQLTAQQKQGLGMWTYLQPAAQHMCAGSCTPLFGHDHSMRQSAVQAHQLKR